jgi:Domain of unknown function (DUF4111)
MPVPRKVDEVVRTFLPMVDRAAPGLVEGLYLHGSVALGDFRVGRSDIDFVAVCADRPGDDAVTALAGVHRDLDRLHPRPYFDGVYLTKADLAAGPDGCPDVPGCHESTFEPSGRMMLCPVTWHELDEHGVVMRGPALEKLALWTDQAVLLAFTRNNLQTYWHGWVAGLDRLAEEASERTSNPWFVDWCVLGSVRLHALLATGRLHSKGSAGRYALGALDSRWHQILTEALRIRDGDEGQSLYADPLHRLRVTRDFVAMVVDANDP